MKTALKLFRQKKNQLHQIYNLDLKEDIELKVNSNIKTVLLPSSANSSQSSEIKAHLN